MAGTMSTPRVISSAPWMTRAKPPIDDVGDSMPVEGLQQAERVEPRRGCQPRPDPRASTLAKKRSRRRSGESMRISSSVSCSARVARNRARAAGRSRRLRRSRGGCRRWARQRPAPSGRSPSVRALSARRARSVSGPARSRASRISCPPLMAASKHRTCNQATTHISYASSESVRQEVGVHVDVELVFFAPSARWRRSCSCRSRLRSRRRS